MFHKHPTRAPQICQTTGPVRRSLAAILVNGSGHFRTAVSVRMKKKGVEKEENKTEREREVLFRWRLLKSSVKVETWRVAVVFLGEDLLEEPEDLSDLELILGWKCMWCLM